jgi:hypothetical protein
MADVMSAMPEFQVSGTTAGLQGDAVAMGARLAAAWDQAGLPDLFKMPEAAAKMESLDVASGDETLGGTKSGKGKTSFVGLDQLNKQIQGAIGSQDKKMLTAAQKTAKGVGVLGPALINIDDSINNKLVPAVKAGAGFGE